MRRIVVSAFSAALSLLATPESALAQSSGQSGDLSISAAVFGDTLTVTASGSRFAGSIASLRYRGVEYVDIADHGRQIQSALSVDNLGECYNPTEAGTARDGTALTSSSRLLSLSNVGNVLQSVNQPAFWLAPGTDYKAPCGLTQFRTAQNTTVLSDYRIFRTMSFYGPSIPNLLNVNVGFTFPENRSSASIETLTGYLPASFSVFLELNRSNMGLVRLSPDQSGAANRMTRNPVIISTPDGRNAMGVISPEIEAPTNALPAYYAYYKWPNLVSKWSCAVVRTKLMAGTTLNFGCHIAVGTVDEVVAALAAYPIAGRTAARMTPVYRFWKSPRSLYTTSFTEGANSITPDGFEGTAFKVFPDQGAGMIPIYRCVAGKASFISLSSICERQTVVGRIGYVYAGQRAGTVPIYRFYNVRNADHYITTSYADGDSKGYVYVGPLGFTMP